MYEKDGKCIYANLHLTSFFLIDFVICMTAQTILEFIEVSEKKRMNFQGLKRWPLASVCKMYSVVENQLWYSAIHFFKLYL